MLKFSSLMTLMIYFQFLLCPGLGASGLRLNSIDSHFTSASGPGSEQEPDSSHSRVQSNIVRRPPSSTPAPASAASSSNTNTASTSAKSRSSKPNSRRPAATSNNNNGHHNNCSLDVREDETFLWRIDTQPPSYFFGTIHVPYTRVWDAVSDNAKKAFKESDQVYFELDLTNPYTIASLTSCQLLPRGLNLSQVLPPGIYRRLRDHLGWVRQEMAGWITEDQVNTFTGYCLNLAISHHLFHNYNKWQCLGRARSVR